MLLLVPTNIHRFLSQGEGYFLVLSVRQSYIMASPNKRDIHHFQPEVVKSFFCQEDGSYRELLDRQD